MEILFIGIIFYFGAIVGSFLNVVILRLPQEKKLTGRSECNFCNHILGAADLFPLLSYLGLGGKCRYCQHRIFPRYFIIELCTGLLFVVLWFVLSPASLVEWFIFIRNCFMVSVLLAVFVIDLEYFIIFDSIIFYSCAVILAFNFLLTLLTGMPLWSQSGYLVSGLAGSILGALPFWLIWYFSKGKWMGFGDVKLGLLLGLALGWMQIFVGYFIAILLGGIVSVFLLVFTKKTLKSQIPFGSFLSLGTFVSLLWGQELLSWYMNFLGF